MLRFYAIHNFLVKCPRWFECTFLKMLSSETRGLPNGWYKSKQKLQLYNSPPLSLRNLRPTPLVHLCTNESASECQRAPTGFVLKPDQFTPQVTKRESTNSTWCNMWNQQIQLVTFTPLLSMCSEACHSHDTKASAARRERWSILVPGSQQQSWGTSCGEPPKPRLPTLDLGHQWLDVWKSLGIWTSIKRRNICLQ